MRREGKGITVEEGRVDAGSIRQSRRGRGDLRWSFRKLEGGVGDGIGGEVVARARSVIMEGGDGRNAV